MVFVMKHNIKYSFYILSATFLFAFLLTMNSPLMSQPQSLVYTTSQQEQEADQQEVLQTSSDPQESKTNTGSINSEQTEGSGEDENNDGDSIKSEVGCSPVATEDPNYVYCNTQQPIQPQQQTSQQPPQQNTPSNPSQNTLTGPTIDSDSSLTNNIPNTKTTIPTQKSFNPAGQYKPGSGQTELSVPGKSNGLARSLTPGAGNAQVEGIPAQPNTNPQTPIDPGNIPISIPDKAYLTVITKMIGFYTGYLKVSDFEICVKSTIQTDGKSRDVDAIPGCANGSASGVQYTVQAPGLITIWVNNLDELGVQSVMIETPNLNNYISAYESKTSTIYISPYLPQ